MGDTPFFIKRANKVHGPFSANWVESALKAERVTVSDEFSLARTGPWFPCADFAKRQAIESLSANFASDAESGLDNEDSPIDFATLTQAVARMPGLESPAQTSSLADSDADNVGAWSGLMESAVGIMERFNQSGALGALGVLVLATMPLAYIATISPRLLIAVFVPVYCVGAITATFAIARQLEDKLFMFFFVSILGCVVSGIPSLLYLMDWLGRAYQLDTLIVADWIFWLAVIGQFGICAHTLRLLVIDQVPLQWCVFYYTFYQLFVGLMVCAWLGTERIMPICLWLTGLDSLRTI
jgi:hypothetical protein